jgi:FHS family L-fucose permease-like MFS transporter
MAGINQVATKVRSTSVSQSYTSALVVLTSLFFMWGFITVLNDILIPHLKNVFSLNYTQAMLIQFCFFLAYFIVSLPAGSIIHKIGYKKGIILGLVVAGVGCLLFYPAAGILSYPLFLVALFIMASGITILQVAANPYVAILGSSSTASSRLNLTQAFNSLGTTLGPLFGSYLILAEATSSVSEAKSVQIPYLGLAVAFFIIAGIFSLFKLPEIKDEDTEVALPAIDENKKESAWGYNHLVLGAVGIAVYVGAEVSIGSFLVNFFSQDNIAGLKEAEAGRFVSFYWGGAMVGRFLGSAVLQKVKANQALAFNALMAIALLLVAIFMDGKIAMWSILGIGLFNSIMFPNIFTLGIDGLGKFTSQGSGILCMAIIGGAVFPLIQGVLADSIGIQNAFFVPVICYLYIVYYGLKGYKRSH